MKTFRRIAAVLIGLVLLLAGYVKTLDPVGAGLMMSEYFKFFGIAFLEPAAKILACLMAFVEEILGLALITGIWRRTVAVVSAALIGFFTILTSVLLVLNPNLDCGCFGSLITLTHLQTFIKNIVLCALWVLAFIPFRTFEKPAKIKYVGFGLTSFVCLAVLLHFIFNIPAIDGTPYAFGTKLYGSMYYNIDAPVLSFYNDEGEYCDSLACEGDKLVISVYDPDELSENDWSLIRATVLSLSGSRYAPLVLVGSVPGYFSRDAGCPVFFSDPSTLVTLNRSNGGATLVEKGEITGKCALHGLPKNASDIEEFVDNNIGGNVMAQGTFLGILSLLLLL